jgi:hypothetical protein
MVNGSIGLEQVFCKGGGREEGMKKGEGAEFKREGPFSETKSVSENG